VSEKNDTGNKTEKPTPKRLDDARKKGDVAKSREVTSTVGLIAWLALAALVVGYAAERIAALYGALFATVGRGWTHDGFAATARALGAQAVELVLLAATLLIPVAAVGLLTDLLQGGPVLTLEKLKPKLEHMNPVEGVKRMFSMDNLIDVVKAVAKTALLFLLGWLIVKSALPGIVSLARAPDLPAHALSAMLWDLTIKLLAWTVALFALLSLLDAVYQRWSFMKKMRMSLRDIRQEMKDSEGDPFIKQQRKQAHQEWSQRNAAQAARTCNVLVVNPTHIAIAIDYDRETSPVPTVAARGQDDLAREMRAAAEEGGVPIVRNIPLARNLFARAEVGEIVPADLFDIVAEVILWAREVRNELDAQRAIASADPNALGARDGEKRRHIAAPGLDLTRYKEPKWTR
jgi:flagellar biosynthetic protein FlhB/type III secretion protein U